MKQLFSEQHKGLEIPRVLYPRKHLDIQASVTLWTFTPPLPASSLLMLPVILVRKYIPLFVIWDEVTEILRIIPHDVNAYIENLLVFRKQCIFLASCSCDCFCFDHGDVGYGWVRWLFHDQGIVNGVIFRDRIMALGPGVTSVPVIQESSELLISC